ncbi:hypothetical protein [Streptosporangium fragile]
MIMIGAGLLLGRRWAGTPSVARPASGATAGEEKIPARPGPGGERAQPDGAGVPGDTRRADRR